MTPLRLQPDLVAQVYDSVPTNGKPYLRCAVGYSFTSDSTMFRIDLPFDRFYLEQGKGARTEDLINQRATQMGPELPAYAVVRILEGEGVIEDLVIGDRSIQLWLQEPK